MAKGKDSVIIYESFLEATEDLEAVAIAEIWRAIRAFIKGEEPTFTDVSAKLAWKFIKLQLEADAQKWSRTCEARAVAGRRGGLKSGKQNEANKANACFALNDEANASKAKQNEANEADTDTDTDTDKKKNIEKEKSFASEEVKVWTLGEFLTAAKEPSVALPEKDATECFDFYAAQGFRRSNGQPIVAVAPLLRQWKRKLGEFAARGGGAKTDASIDAYSLERAFEWFSGHYLGDYDDDPRGEDQLRAWATENGIFGRLRNPNDKLYQHVYKTRK